MSRSNPLFIDSTKSNSDGVGTQIELNGLVLRDEERVRCEVTDSNGRKKQILLVEEGESRYCGQTWLNHHEEITLKFIVDGERGTAKIESPLLKRVASYALIETWSPKNTKKRRSSKPVAKVERQPVTEEPLVSEKLGKLIAKWGL